MKEISENVIIDTSLSGVTVGVIKTPKGVIFIDSPLTPKDVQSWRTIAVKTDSGPSRLQILLDEHFDRTACAVPIKCPVLAHEKTSKAIQSRPSTFRLPTSDTGSEWELYPEIGPMQWINPEITFTQAMKLELDDDVVELDYHPGPSKGAIWVGMPGQKIVFIGDTVVVEEPPFLENADIDLWLEELEILRSDKYKGYTIISGRSGVIEKNDVQDQIRFLNLAKKRLEKFSTKIIDAGQVEKLAISFLETFPTKTKRIQEHYKARLKWGINQYYGRTIR
jgi:glyoxylase-like metal-dependent hydrolase (beta-lactamase superfamily II)